MDTVHKIMLVDDHTLFRDGMRRLLDNRPDCKVVAEASNGAEFLQTVRTTPDIADVVFMDIDMPVIGGIEASQKALEINPELKIITLSMHGDQEYYFKMVSVGVKGFLLKSSDFDEVLSAIDTVSGGGSYFSQELLCSLVRELKPSTEPRSENSSRSAKRKCCCSFVRVFRIRRLPNGCSSPRGRWTSTARTFSTRRVAGTRRIWSCMQSKIHS